MWQWLSQPRQWWGTTPWQHPGLAACPVPLVTVAFGAPLTHQVSRSLVTPIPCGPTPSCERLLPPHLVLLFPISSGRQSQHPRHRCSLSLFSHPIRSRMPPVLLQGDITHVPLQRVLGRGEEVLAVRAANSHGLQLGWLHKQSRGEKPPLQGKCVKPKGRRCAGSLPVPCCSHYVSR